MGILLKRNKSMIKRNSFSGILFDNFNYLFMVLFSLTIIYPFWDLWVLSISPQTEASSLSFNLWPKNPTLDAFRYVLGESGTWIAYRNTIFRTIFAVILTIIVTLFGAYPLSKKNLRMRNFITLFFVFAMFFGGGLIPTYIWYRELGLIDNMLVYILPGLSVPFYIIILRNFLMSIDKGLEESAYIDGAGYFRILISIIIPLSKPVLATLALWIAISHWNSWFDCLVYINDNNKIILQILIRRMIMVSQQMIVSLQEISATKREVFALNVRAVTTLITIGPIIAVYPFAQKYFIKGIMIGSLKG